MSEQAAPALPNFDPFNEKDVLEALAEENADIAKRTAALLGVADSWDKIAEIKTDAQAEKLTTFLAQISNISGDKGLATTRRNTRKKQYTVIGDAVYKYFNDHFVNKLEPRKKTLAAKLGVYLQKKKAAADAEAARLAAEAAKLSSNAQTAEEVEQAVVLSKAAGAAAKSTGVKTDFGQGAHTTSTWKFRVKDLKDVPLAYLQVNEALVNKVIKGKNGLRNINGLEIYEETSTVIRT